MCTTSNQIFFPVEIQIEQPHFVAFPSVPGLARNGRALSAKLPARVLVQIPENAFPGERQQDLLVIADVDERIDDFFVVLYVND